MPEKLKYLLVTFEDITLSSSNNIGCTKSIKIDIETDPNLPLVAFNPYVLPLKHQEWVTKELEDLGKTGIIQRSLSPKAVMLVDMTKEDEKLAQLHSSKFFTRLNLRHGYYHIKLNPQTRHKSVFMNIFSRMLFRLAEVAAYFTVLM